ncbi:class I SAM-dependent methyltransferase [uncultured Desulfuromonas sp.]|uniref:class I SAM-dependent methyltransferase n=1 Tax=uncultured Desulfuromonas sp. TaxID=181013 RepID=UPI002AAA91C5|nr:class I SAM-dependent methyltransferase [uncultured Desulfuromonas sp.]
MDNDQKHRANKTTMMTKNLVAGAAFKPESLELPDAWVGHLPFAAWVVRECHPTMFVELGTHSGNSYFAFCQSVKEADLQTKCYAVDTWQGDEHAGNYGDDIFAAVHQENQEKYAAFSRLLRMTFDEAVDSFSDGSINLLHIDGLHTYDAVRHDFETWLPKLAPGALVLLHDSNVRERGFGVWKFWEELKQRYPHYLEFNHSHGLGVVQVDSQRPQRIYSFLDPAQNQEIVAYFSALGAQQLDRFELLRMRKQNDELKRLVEERDGRNDVLNHAVAERDGWVAQLHDSVEERDATIRSLYDVINGRDDQLHALQKNAEEKDRQLVEKDRQIIERDQQIVDIYKSWSWRLTRPVRAAGRVKNTIAGSLPVRFLRNGFLSFRAGVRRYGFVGFMRRFPYYFRNVGRYFALFGARAPSGEALLELDVVQREPVRLLPDLTGVCEPLDNSISVVIPTLNAGREFRCLLQKLRQQKGVGPVEIIVVDSGSRDDTVALAHHYACRVIEILPEEFSHSYARNLGADTATSDYLLFMVQDAYPIGQYWFHGLVSYLQEHADENLAAVSCSEYSRSDSDMMYDSMIQTHYQFLGCLDRDRIGSYQGESHMSLRANGQLSDVSCLIGRELFGTYRYRGDYAEDLDLGIRLIRDDYRVAMLSSVKVIHSHNRPAYYYLKRSFVDVVFLVGMFDDFEIPRITSFDGVMAGIISTAAHLSVWLNQDVGTDNRQHALAALSQRWRKEFTTLILDQAPQLGDDPLDRYLETLCNRYVPSKTTLDKKATEQAQRFVESFLARLDHFDCFVSSVYRSGDPHLSNEARSAVIKIFAATAGAELAYLYLDRKQRGPEQELAAAQTIYQELKVGV